MPYIKTQLTPFELDSVICKDCTGILIYILLIIKEKYVTCKRFLMYKEVRGERYDIFLQTSERSLELLQLKVMWLVEVFL